MCEAEEPPYEPKLRSQHTDRALPDTIMYRGFKATWEELQSAGWQIVHRKPFYSWTRPSDSAAAKEYIYLRHKSNNEIARLLVDEWNYVYDERGNSSAELDYLTHERNQRIKPNKVYEQADLTERDIPGLLDLVLKLQTKFYPKPKPKPNTKVVQLRKTA